MGIIDIICMPFAWLMRMVFEISGSYGLSIVAFAIMMKIIMLPFGIKQQKNTLKNLRWQPKMQALREKYGADKQKYAEEFQKLQQEGYNPMGGCGSTILSMVVILILYQIVRMPLTYLMQMDQGAITAAFDALKAAGLEGKVVLSNQIGLLELMQAHPDVVAPALNGAEIIKTSFMGWNLATTPVLKFNWLLALPVLSGITSYIFGVITQKLNPMSADANPSGGSNMMMILMMPVMSIIFGFMLPAGLTLYFVISNFLGMGQSYALNHFMNPKKELARIEAEEQAKKEARKNKKKKKYLD